MPPGKSAKVYFVVTESQEANAFSIDQELICSFEFWVVLIVYLVNDFDLWNASFEE